MKKTFQKTCSIILTVLLLFTAVPLVGLQTDADSIVESVSHTAWTLENGLLTISGTGPMLADMSWRTDNQYNIYSVVIENGITSIDESAFFACENLTNISVPTSVTSIDSGAFAYCRALTSITVPDSVTHIGNNAFAYCTNLENIILSKNLTSIGRFAFSGCPITSITIPDSLTSIGTGILSETPYSANKSNWTNGLLYCGNHLIDVAYGVSGEVSVKEGTLTLADASFGRNPGLVDMSIANESITSIILPDSLQYVGNYQFCDCSALQSVSFGKNTKQIGDGCFARAPELDIYYRGSSADWDKIEISYTGEHTNDLSNCTFHFAEQDTAFKNSDNAVLTENGDLLGIADTTVQALLQQAGTDAKLYKADGTEKEADAKIGTGDKLVLADGTELIVSVLGDLNGDGEVATSDARLALRKAVNLETFDNAHSVAADVDNNKEVGVADARMILRASVNLDKAENWFADIAK